MGAVADPRAIQLISTDTNREHRRTWKWQIMREMHWLETCATCSTMLAHSAWMWVWSNPPPGNYN